MPSFVSLLQWKWKNQNVFFHVLLICRSTILSICLLLKNYMILKEMFWMGMIGFLVWYSLSWKLHCVTPVHYLSLYFTEPIINRLVPTTLLQCSIHDQRYVDYLRLFAFFFSDVALSHYQYQRFDTSLLAVACFMCAKHELQIKYYFWYGFIVDLIGMIRIKMWCRQQVRRLGWFMMNCGGIILGCMMGIRHKLRRETSKFMGTNDVL